MKFIQCTEYFEQIRTIVAKDILFLGLAAENTQRKDSLKVKKCKSKEDSLDVACNRVFGNSISSLPALFVENFGYVPRFLVDCLALLDKHLEVEGLFRKAGSVARQREFKGRVDAGEKIDDSCSPLDICCLIKQFFRELPDPLMTFELYSTLMNCFIHLKEDKDRRASIIVNLCILLPHRNLSTLMYLMTFLSKLTTHSNSNRMDAYNVAVCLAPNLLYSLDIVKNKKLNLNSVVATPSKQRSSDSLVGSANSLSTETFSIELETEIIRLLIENAHRIGEVSEAMYNRAAKVSSSESALDIESCEKKMKKRGSGSLQGLVSNLGSSFSRWLSNKSSAHDNSINNMDRSSFVSDESLESYEKESNVTMKDYNVEEMMAEISKMPHTPKIVMNSLSKKLAKRKPEQDCFTPKLGFSAIKRKALMKSFPQSNILNSSPYPHVLKQDEDDYVGPMKDMRELNAEHANSNRSFNVRPASGSKLKRVVSMRKAGALSPKSSNVKMKFRGLLRRLSGNKERKKNQSKDQANESICSKDTSLLSSNTHSMVLVPRPPLLGPIRLPEALQSVLFGEMRGYTPPKNSTDDESCRDLKRIRKQRDTGELLDLHNKLMRDCDDLTSSYRATVPNGVLETFFPELEMTSEEISIVDENPADMSSSILRRGRPNTVRNGLKSLTLHKKESNDSKRFTNETFQNKMNLLETSPISSTASKSRNDDDEPNEEDRDSDETVVRLLDVAFTEEDLQSMLGESEESLLKVDGEMMPVRDDEDLCDSRDVIANESVDLVEHDCLISLCEDSTDSHENQDSTDLRVKDEIEIPPGSEVIEPNLNTEEFVKDTLEYSSAEPILTSDSIFNSTIDSSESQIENIIGNNDEEMSSHSCETNSLSETVLQNAQIRRPSFKVTSDVQYLVANSGRSSDRFDLELEDDCIQSTKEMQRSFIDTTQEGELSHQKVHESLWSAEIEDKPVRSKKVARLPLSTSFNIAAINQRSFTAGVERADSNSEEHLNYSGNIKENTVSHLPPLVPHRPRKIHEQITPARCTREEDRVLQRLKGQDEVSLKLIKTSCAPPSSQPKIKEPLIASRVAKYLAMVQASSSTTADVSSPRTLRSPMKGLKRLQQPTSPKPIKSIGPTSIRKSPMKPLAPQNQSDGCVIKFDLDV